MTPAEPTSPDEALIRAARTHSNRSIARRNLLGVADSLDADFNVTIGDGTFVPTRDAYLKLFKQGFDAPKTSLTYERLPDRIEISTDATLASEQGHWIAKDYTGATTHTGAYSAMWRQTPTAGNSAPSSTSPSPTAYRIKDLRDPSSMRDQP